MPITWIVTCLDTGVSINYADFETARFNYDVLVEYKLKARLSFKFCLKKINS